MVFAGTGVWKSKRGTPLLGCRCVFINDEQYGYNVRDELISADEVSYAYDDIGNRTTAEGKTYTANNLNQYTAIDDFAPQYDDDGIHAPTSMSEVGNQTLIKTETGIWRVTYNAENRPIYWQSGDAVITMAFDRLGRRVEYHETRAGQVATHFCFVYDNYLCVQRLNAANGNAVRTEFVWDPTEPIATRPFIMRANFGAVSRTSRATRVTNRDVLSENPFRFSSEYHDAPLALVYYNYRHYNPKDGRWLGRDPLEEEAGRNLFSFVRNSLNSDALGRSVIGDTVTFLWEGTIQSGRVVKDGAVAMWNGTFYVGKVVQTFSGTLLMAHASILNGEAFAELYGDESRRQLSFTEEEGCRFNISINGMANKDGTAFRDLLENKLKQKVYPLDNVNTWTIPFVGSDSLGGGDLMQSAWYEMGGQDFLSLHLANAVATANERGKANNCSKICIVIYAHSQGTMVARRGFDLLKYLMGDQAALANVTFCGYGGETRIDANEFGLRSATNVSNPWDPISRGWGFLRDLGTKAETGPGVGHSTTQYIRRR